jgi:hypothetical protein
MPNRLFGLAPAPCADGVEIDDFLVASTIRETEREATAKAARAFQEFWNTGNEAQLKQVLEENFTNHSLTGRRPND